MTTTHPTATATPTPGLVHPLAGAFLLLDAATTSVNGLAYVAAAGALADWLGPSATLLRWVGVFLLAFGAGVAVLATRRPVPRRAVGVLAGLNAAWVVASLSYVVVEDLTTLGTVWGVLQAVVVGAFAAGQAWLVRRG